MPGTHVFVIALGKGLGFCLKLSGASDSQPRLRSAPLTANSSSGNTISLHGNSKPIPRPLCISPPLVSPSKVPIAFLSPQADCEPL